MIDRQLSPRPSADPALLGARASVVNRTRRIVRAHAQDLREQRSRRRSLWAPVAISSTLLLFGCYAVWTLLDGYDVTSDGVIDSSDQLFLLMLWLLPATALLFGYIWSRRARNKTNQFGEVSS